MREELLTLTLDVHPQPDVKQTVQPFKSTRYIYKFVSGGTKKRNSCSYPAIDTASSTLSQSIDAVVQMDANNAVDPFDPLVIPACL